MKRGMAVVLMAASLVAADDPRRDLAARDFQIRYSDDKNIQGAWVMVSMESYGQKQSHDKTFVFKDGKYFGAERGQPEEQIGEFSLDQAKNPKWIDMTPFFDGTKGDTSPGIYTLKGDELTICLEEGEGGGAKWPTEFKSKVGSSVYVMILKRKMP
jgi:uncharacterized protein (TIGR03067 family)